MKNIILIGAGGHAKSCIDVIESTGEYNILGLIDLKEKIGEDVLGYKIIDSDENIKNYVNSDTCFLITLGHLRNPDRRIALFNYLKSLNANLPVIISKHAIVSKHASIGEGTIVMHGAMINAGAVVGSNCIINSKSLLEHEVIVGNNCHISTSATLNGQVNVGEGSFIGSNTTVVQCVIIANNAFVKAGSLIK